MNQSKQKTWDIISEPTPVMDSDGDKIWYNSIGQIHRNNDKPAILWMDGDKYWYKNGRLHRDNDLPAVVEANGRKE